MNIRFQGFDKAGDPQLFRLNIAESQFYPMTAFPRGFSAVSVVGKTILAEVPEPNAPSEGRPAYPMHVFDFDDVLPITAPKLALEHDVTLVSFADKKPWAMSSIKPLVLAAADEDGRRLALLTSPRLDDVPAHWIGYDRLRRSPRSSRVESGQGVYFVRNIPRFTIVDADRGVERPAFDAPSGLATDVGRRLSDAVPPSAYWLQDGRHVVLVNTALPLDPGGPAERKTMAYVVVFDAEDGTWVELEPLEARVEGETRRITGVGLLPDKRSIRIEHRTGSNLPGATVYNLRDGRWVGGSATPPMENASTHRSDSRQTSNQLVVSVKEGQDTPPNVVASVGGKSISLLPPDPALANVRILPTRTVVWKTPSGHEIKGGLVLPESGKRPFPLVIQAYRYEPDKFRPDGPEGDAYAAQSLAARGIAVLTISLPAEEPGKVQTLAELTDFVVYTDSAADWLSSQGLIDRSRVGLIGFSRAGFAAFYAVTHPGEVAPAAVIIDDSYSGTYGNDLISQAAWGYAGKSNYGGIFWTNKEQWLRYESSFNVDAVRTPTLMTTHNQTSIPYKLDVIGAFGLTRRPFEFMVFPDAVHGLQMPRQRLASTQLSVDWMSFWLQGSVPDDKDQAVRWTDLKATWDKQQAWEMAGHAVGSMPPADFEPPVGSKR
ncbi:MAG: prolyl oligopeptidase family serine peptidase [Pseudomonadota bacterium]